MYFYVHLTLGSYNNSRMVKGVDCLGLPIEQAALLPLEYLNAVIDDDVYRIDGVKRATSMSTILLRRSRLCCC